MGSFVPSLQLQGQQQQELLGGQDVPPMIAVVLQHFAYVFQDPQGLPPRRSHDHSITLQEGAQPVSMRPYRYPFYQNAEIEKNYARLAAFRGYPAQPQPFLFPSFTRKESRWHMDDVHGLSGSK